MKQFTKVISAAIIALQMLSQAALADAGTFQQIITRQIEAFRAGDGSTAFGFAAPQLQMLFQTPENFMAMVSRGYAAVKDPRSFSFGETVTDGEGRPVQTVEVTDQAGVIWTARYTFARQADGSWRIASVTLEKSQAADV